jgi:hypothetical protein
MVVSGSNHAFSKSEQASIANTFLALFSYNCNVDVQVPMLCPLFFHDLLMYTLRPVMLTPMSLFVDCRICDGMVIILRYAKARRLYL